MPAGKNGGHRSERSVGRRFYSLPGDLVRYDVRSQGAGRLEHRVGIWKLAWNQGAATHLEPVEETLTFSQKPWFRDVTGAAFAGVPSFHEQLTKGMPYWRARLDPACGIDLYGENGIAVADIDGDGWDEIYVCQPGGLPNRLYKNDGNGPFPGHLDRTPDSISSTTPPARSSSICAIRAIRTWCWCAPPSRCCS